jgi:hypothetical protein
MRKTKDSNSLSPTCNNCFFLKEEEKKKKKALGAKSASALALWALSMLLPTLERRKDYS